MAKSRNCPVCEKLSKHIVTLGQGEHDTYDVYGCSSCGLTFVGSYVQPEKAHSYYDSEYYDSAMCAAINPLREELERRVVRAQVQRLAKFIKVPGRFLDVGCGDGVHLKLFREMGWEVHGTEVSQAAAKHVKEQYGIDVRLGEFLDVPFDAGQFDVIQMRHVIEHLTSPRQVLAKVWDLLRPGGVTCIDTPNRGLVSKLYPIIDSALVPFANLRRRFMGRPLRKVERSADHWGILHPPEHNLWFTSKAMKLLLEATGFNPIWIMTSYRGHLEHYPSKSLLRGERESRWNRLWFYVDVLGSKIGAGGILVVYAQK